MKEQLAKHIHGHPFPLLFATLSGAHLYGFPSEDSDYDLRGVHLLPLEQVVGLKETKETVTTMYEEDGLEIDLVTHDAAKFFGMMLKRNGYVLEQLYSPHVLHTSPEHDELKELGKGCITRFHAHHYLGFAQNQWKMFTTEENKRAKPLLYTYRVLLTGIHLMRTGVIEANLRALKEDHNLPFLDELIRFKTENGEKANLADVDIAFHEKHFNALVRLLAEERDRSKLPQEAEARDGLNDLLVRIRLQGR